MTNDNKKSYYFIIQERLTAVLNIAD